MATTVITEIRWLKLEAGEIARCRCGRGTFLQVLHNSVTWLCLRPLSVFPPSGGCEYRCRYCRSVYWGYTVRADEAGQPPRLAA